MSEGLLLVFTGWAIGATLYTIHWVRGYVEQQRRAIEEQVREAVREEWSNVHQHLDRMEAALDARLAIALARQWDNGTKGRRNP